MGRIKLSLLLRYSAYGFFVVALIGGALLYGLRSVVADDSAPPRPQAVPQEAIWAGGADGGAWILCAPVPSGEALLSCRVFYDGDGRVWAHGDYLPVRIAWDATKDAPVSSPAPLPASLDYEGFDGVALFLKDNITLVPHGTIDYPAPDGHGKRQTYRVGEPQGAEIAY